MATCRFSAASVALVMVSISEPAEGGVLELAAESQGIDVRLGTRRWAMAGGNGGNSLLPRSGA